MKIEEIYKCFLECNSVTTDTRKIELNSMFFALKGPNFNANSFAKEALEKGAKYAIIDDEKYNTSSNIILVEDVLKTLQELANHHRKILNTTLIGLTGSNGKTTTKELIDVVLKEKYKTIATIGNLNNHIGVPLTLLRLTKVTEIGIIEMGANHQKEIEFLCKIAEPDFGYITNFGKAHLEGFGGVEGIIKGKSELYTFLKENNKIAFINIDDRIQVEKTKEIKQKTFGLNNSEASVVFNEIEANPMATITIENTKIQSNLIGIYNATNLMSAVTIGLHFKIDLQTIKKAINNYAPTNNRSQIIEKGSNNIILDAYNANPTSMLAALENLNSLEAKNKIALLGDMFELGEESKKEHQFIINYLKTNKIQALLIGYEFYKEKIDHESILFFETYLEFEKYIKQNTITKTTILLKGSRGMQLERILDFL